MHKAKKKNSDKTAKIPKPIKIKKEKTEEDRLPHPISHYIDDRLELVKQIFGSLKPKTITNLAPDFLKKKSLEEIEELCLNELLGISTKRLKATINATKCPTDTESSEDSDVHNIEEHVSLEEISSGSEIGGGASTKKKISGGSKKGASGKNGKNEADGQISVLELLELQARARAIRSQLALEPVTKIEVDSDGEPKVADAEKPSSTKSKESRKERKRKSTDMAATSKTKKTNPNAATTSASAPSSLIQSNGNTETHKENNSTTVEPKKKIKLKRNFRTNKEVDEKEKEPTEKEAKIKDEKLSRSASPDVIPIVAEPETLLINDSSSEDEAHSATSTTAPKSTDQNESKVIEQQSKPIEQQQKEQEEKQEVVKDVTNSRERRITEPEDGEISEDFSVIPENGKNKENIQEKVEKNYEKSTSDKEDTVNSILFDDENDKRKTLAEIEPKTDQSEAQKDSSTVLADKGMSTEKETPESDLKEKQSPKIESKSSQSIDDEDDDQNDDVISIEGGDLETEMIEHLEEHSDVKMSSFKKEKDENTARSNPKDIQDEDDIISLDSSEDELANKEDLESWNTRWLKSSKVNKVLLTSRLGKRVRDKIKKTKRSKRTISRAEDEDGNETNKASSSYTSKHEDGSVEQYKELLEMKQRKA